MTLGWSRGALERLKAPAAAELGDLFTTSDTIAAQQQLERRKSPNGADGVNVATLTRLPLFCCGGMSSRSQTRDSSQSAEAATACSRCVCQVVPTSRTPSCTHWDRTALVSGETFPSVQFCLRLDRCALRHLRADSSPAPVARGYRPVFLRE